MKPDADIPASPSPTTALDDERLAETAAQLRHGDRPHQPTPAPGGGGGDERPHPDLGRDPGDDRAPRPADPERGWPRSSG